MGKKLIITAALCGAGTTKKQTPCVPITPEEIAADAVACAKAGAAVIHIHVRDENGVNSMDTKRFCQVVDLVREECGKAGVDPVLNLTTSGSKWPEDIRRAHLPILKPEMCSYDPGTMNWANSYIFSNSPAFLEQLGHDTQELGIKPECEIFDGGMMGNVDYYVKKGVLKGPKEELAQMTANEFVNVKDIRGSFLYTRDGMALAYLKIFPISTELFSKNEKRLIAKQLTASLSSGQYPFQLLAVSRPVDISPLMAELSSTLTSSSDIKQKELLKHEIVEMGGFALSGEVVERQFYIKIWDRAVDGVERDLLQKLKYLSGYFADCGIQTEILEQQDIVRLCNLVNNPAYVHLEDAGFEAAIPILESVGVV